MTRLLKTCALLAAMLALAPKAHATENLTSVAVKVSSSSSCGLITVGATAVEIMGSTTTFSSAFVQNWSATVNTMVGPNSSITYDITTARASGAGVWVAPGAPGGNASFLIPYGKTLYAISDAGGGKLLVCGAR